MTQELYMQELVKDFALSMGLTKKEAEARVAGKSTKDVRFAIADMRAYEAIQDSDKEARRDEVLDRYGFAAQNPAA